MQKPTTDGLRNIIFGAEDSLVSTVGVLFGVATATMEREYILLTGVTVIVVEALSMGVGSYLSEKTTQEYSGSDNTLQKNTNPILDGLLMFFSYFIAGCITLIPYLIMEGANGRFVSIAVSLVFLFFLGFIPNKKIGSGFRMVILGGFAIAAGFAVGYLFKVN